ncbi:MAG: hypothetical protein ACI89X_004003 [Planctomycetota bacterium]|jgi:hypothetical protein
MANYVLEILDGDRAGEVLPVGESTIRIGRKAGNDIVLTDEKTSGVHCEILPEGDRLVLKDLGSTNGTFLDGKRVNELVLTPGDVVTIGRTKVKFSDRAGDGASAGADAGEFAMRTIDAGRLQKRGGSIGLIVVLLLVVAGGGGWYWWDGQQQSAGNIAGPKVDTTPLAVSGNRLPDSSGSCETDEGWSLRTAGIGFRSDGQPNTGLSSFTAYFEEDDGDAEPSEAKATKSDDDFAVMQLAEPIEVFAGRSFTVAGHCRTTGGAQIAVRARVFASNEDVPFRFCHGTKMAAYEEWQRVEATVTVPTGCDRLLLEVVALLPNKDAEALIDDLAVVEGGTANGIEVPLEELGQTAFGFGSSVAVRSTDKNNPGTVLAIQPDAVPASMARLHKAGHCVLSDLGVSIVCAAADGGLDIALTGTQSMQFVMPSDAAGGLLVAEAQQFASAQVESEASAQKVLFGSHATRAMLQFEGKTKVRGTTGGGLYRLSIAANKAQLMLGFRAERLRADDYVRTAQSYRAEGRPGDALDELAKLFLDVPMDSEALANAQRVRREILEEQSAHVAMLRKDLEEADFFTTRGGFDRVASGVDELIGLYGEHNVEDLAGAKALQVKAKERLTAVDQATHEVQRARLTDLADAFGSVKQPALQKIVTDYVTRHLNGK